MITLQKMNSNVRRSERLWKSGVGMKKWGFVTVLFSVMGSMLWIVATFGVIEKVATSLEESRGTNVSAKAPYDLRVGIGLETTAWIMMLVAIALARYQGMFVGTYETLLEETL